MFEVRSTGYVVVLRRAVVGLKEIMGRLEAKRQDEVNLGTK